MDTDYARLSAILETMAETRPTESLAGALPAIRELEKRLADAALRTPLVSSTGEPRTEADLANLAARLPTVRAAMTSGAGHRKINAIKELRAYVMTTWPSSLLGGLKECKDAIETAERSGLFTRPPF